MTQVTVLSDVPRPGQAPAQINETLEVGDVGELPVNLVLFNPQKLHFLSNLLVLARPRPQSALSYPTTG